ncbi:hemerythrin domain-containing protein [Streptomyces sp. NPDC047108]|uniref:hemerythrin domain-containing protein n=1 Tax=Streptomyces sp. NPDC047108 TaxID=3155025 RepID=UPI00340A7055
MPKIDLYRNVHMGQRARLFALAVDVGSADVADPKAVSEVIDRCLAMTGELREHADHEDTFIHPLLRDRAPQAAAALDAEHLRLDAALAELDAHAGALPLTPAAERPDAQHRLYLALNELISAYLAHLHAEETVAMPALRNSCGEDELRAAFRGFLASRTSEERALDMQRMLFALPPSVREEIAPGA